MHILVLDYIDGLIEQEYNVRHIGSGYSQGNSFKENCAKTIYVLLVTIKVMENIYSHPLQTVLRI